MSALVEAWQAALAAEQRAYFGYGLLGPWTSGARADRARTDLAAHADLRDATATALQAEGVRPQAPAADYQLDRVTGAASAVALAVSLEDGCAQAWRYLYSVATAASGKAARMARRAAQQALTDSAVRATEWRGTTVPFPGI